jgi:bacillopeptidase F
LKVEGLTDTDAIVYQAGYTDRIPVDNRGRFEIERQLTEGSNILEVLASDNAGNTTRTSREVILITQPPELSLIGPGIDQWYNEAIIEVSGVAPNAASVTVNNQPATLAEDGTFNREIILQEGDNPIRVAATDDVGNITTQERLVHLNTIPP